MDGYHRTDEQLTELDDGEWKSVGDVAYVDDEGYVYICDRKKDMIISGGVNIYPAEIEAVLYAHPQVLDVAVFGIPDDEWGERVHAIVQAKPGETIDLDELRAFVDEPRSRGYKRPRGYELRAELPRTDSGKLLKRVLRDEYWPEPRPRGLSDSSERRAAHALGAAIEGSCSRRYGVPCSTSASSPIADGRGRGRGRARLPGRREAVRRRDRAQDRARPRAPRARATPTRSRAAATELLAAARPTTATVELLVAPMVRGTRELIAGRRTATRSSARA